VEKFGIKITVVEPGFFRTDLLDAHNVRWVSKAIEDYASEGTAEDMWSPYNGTQPNDPAKLGDALVKIAAMQNPPKVFAAGSDAQHDHASDRGPAARYARPRNAVQGNGRFVLKKAEPMLNQRL
jgi:NAD(P)-dependent dehydrogenase (short-subunit alcohol dehydrogenase family)